MKEESYSSAPLMEAVAATSACCTSAWLKKNCAW